MHSNLRYNNCIYHIDFIHTVIITLFMIIYLDNNNDTLKTRVRHIVFYFYFVETNAKVFKTAVYSAFLRVCTINNQKNV